MSLKIRLTRGGAKKRPYYRIVVAESRFARDGRFVEHIGTYNPMLGKEDPKRVTFDTERAKKLRVLIRKPLHVCIGSGLPLVKAHLQSFTDPHSHALRAFRR